jgi:hypothetical protein
MMRRGNSSAIAVVLASAALALGAAPAAAASSNHSEPGVPGTPECHGQTTAALAQEFGPGIGHAAKSVGLSVHGLQELVDVVCAL